MLDLTIVVDESLPSTGLVVSLDGSELKVQVSPKVEASVLTALASPIASEVAAAIDTGPTGRGSER